MQYFDNLKKTKQLNGFIYTGKGKKKIEEYSIKVGGWGQQWTDFPLLNMSLNPLKLPKNHFKTNIFSFFNFWWGDPPQL